MRHSSHVAENQHGTVSLLASISAAFLYSTYETDILIKAIEESHQNTVAV